MEKAIQRESLDVELRNGLWTAFFNIYIEGLNFYDGSYSRYPYRAELRHWATQVWTAFLKQAGDTEGDYGETIEVLRKKFFQADWHWVLDFLEFSVKTAKILGSRYADAANVFFQRENSVYRFVGNEIIEITDKTEIEAIETAIEKGPKAAKLHLNQALAMLSDRKSPDYRNSIKEAISAVEAVCRLISGADKDTLGPALKKVTAKAPMHGAFKDALLKLYGFTSDEGGIRHSLMEESTISYADAKFMLVLCSGFVNFMLGKCAELGLKFG